VGKQVPSEISNVGCVRRTWYRRRFGNKTGVEASKEQAGGVLLSLLLGEREEHITAKSVCLEQDIAGAY
jgi:hypothetical protein